MRKGQATEPVRTRSCRVVKSEAGGRFTRHISPGVLVRRAATSGDRGALSGYVSCLWCSGRQHATCTFVSSRRRAGKPTPAVGLRDLPLPEAGVCPPPSEKRCALNADSDLRMDIVIERGGLRDASASDFRHTSILIDVTYADEKKVRIAVGKGKKSLLCDPGSELRLGGSGKREAKILKCPRFQLRVIQRVYAPV